VTVGGVSGWVVYSPPNWKQYGTSPIWFETWWDPKKRPRFPAVARVAVGAAFAKGAKQPPNQPWMSASCPGAITVPLTIVPNSTEDVVLKSIVLQLDDLEGTIQGFAG